LGRFLRSSCQQYVSHSRRLCLVLTSHGARLASPSPGITSQDFSGTQTQTQGQRPLYTLDEPHAHLFATDDADKGADPVDLDLALGLEEFDLGLGQDAFGDPLPLEE
jgi:hypothetical protein